jgi:hypothetical protein
MPKPIWDKKRDTLAIKWSEDDLQMAIAQYLRRAGICFAADQNAGRRSLRDGARRKAMGMTAGEPDIRLYLPGGRCVFIELKAKTGSVSPEQKARHEELRAMGFVVHVIKSSTPEDAIEKLIDILKKEHAL